MWRNINIMKQAENENVKKRNINSKNEKNASSSLKREEKEEK